MVRPIHLTALALLTLTRGAFPAPEAHPIENRIEAKIEAQLDGLEKIYRAFHQHPELSFQEEQTAARLAAAWEQAGLEVTRKVGGHGVVGVLRNGAGKTVMLRTDLDALPVEEQTGLSFASRVKVTGDSGAKVGVMHACGHDVHMTNLVGAARCLSEFRSAWSGTILFVGQPAEERGAGAKAMLEDGLFTRFPKPDYALALHVDPALAAGSVAYVSGHACANVDSVDITMLGRGGHGAYPHTTLDPVVLAARLVMDLQTIVSREIDPIAPAVITVGSIQGGTKHNIIGSECRLQLTVRSYADEVRQHLLEAITRKARAAALSANAPEPKIQTAEGTPSLYNDPALVARLLPVLERALTEENVKAGKPTMGGEDFGRYGTAGVPIFLLRLGAVSSKRLAAFRNEGIPPPSLHSPQFYPDARDTLRTGVLVLTQCTLALLHAP